MRKNKSLGKGLDALFEQVEETKHIPKEEIQEIEVKKIKANPDQVRKDFDEDAIKELAESIKAHGLLEPILLTPYQDGYMIVAGERRYRATISLGRDKIPAIVRDFPKEDIKKLSLIENIQRENLNPIEEALSYEELMKEADLTQADFAKEIGKSRSHVANVLRLLKLDPLVMEDVRTGAISFGHAKVLSGLPLKDQQVLAKKIKDLGLNVRQTEKESKKTKGSEENIFIKEIEEDLQSKFMAKVRVNDKKGKGSIVIDYHSMDELDRLIELLNSI